MQKNWIQDAEREVMTALAPKGTQPVAKELVVLVREVRSAHREYDPAQLKVAALNLVSKGRARLDEDCRLVAV